MRPARRRAPASAAASPAGEARPRPRRRSRTPARRGSPGAFSPRRALPVAEQQQRDALRSAPARRTGQPVDLVAPRRPRPMLTSSTGPAQPASSSSRRPTPSDSGSGGPDGPGSRPPTEAAHVRPAGVRTASAGLVGGADHDHHVGRRRRRRADRRQAGGAQVGHRVLDAAELAEQQRRVRAAATTARITRAPGRTRAGGRVPRMRGDHVEHLPGLGDLVHAVDPGAVPGADRGGGERADEPLPHRPVEGLADEVLVGQRHQHRPAGRDHLVEAAGDLQRVPGVLVEVVRRVDQHAARGRRRARPPARRARRCRRSPRRTTSSYDGRCGGVRGVAPLVCVQTSAAPCSAATSASAGSWPPHASLSRSAPARADLAADLGAPGVHADHQVGELGADRGRRTRRCGGAPRRRRRPRRARPSPRRCRRGRRPRRPPERTRSRALSSAKVAPLS